MSGSWETAAALMLCGLLAWRFGSVLLRAAGLLCVWGGLVEIATGASPLAGAGTLALGALAWLGGVQEDRTAPSLVSQRNVGGLDVSMDDPQIVGLRDACEQAAQHCAKVVPSSATALSQVALDGAAIDVLAFQEMDAVALCGEASRAFGRRACSGRYGLSRRMNQRP